MKGLLSILVLFLGFSTAASANSGMFCNVQEHVIQFVCNEYPPYGGDWVNQGNGCYHRDTHQYCNNPYGHDYPIGQGPNDPGYGPSCGPSWPTQGQFWCDQNRAEHQRICGCRPDGFNNPSLWVDENNGCFSHVTGRRCY